MKITNDGKIKLQKNERKIGEFVVKNNEEAGIHLRTTSGNWSMTLKSGGAYELLKMCLDENSVKVINDYLAVIYMASSVLFDYPYLEKLDDAVSECIDRNRKYYVPVEETEEEIIGRMKQEIQLMDDLKTVKTEE